MVMAQHSQSSLYRQCRSQRHIRKENPQNIAAIWYVCMSNNRPTCQAAAATAARILEILSASRKSGKGKCYNGGGGDEQQSASASALKAPVPLAASSSPTSTRRRPNMPSDIRNNGAFSIPAASEPCISARKKFDDHPALPFDDIIGRTYRSNRLGDKRPSRGGIVAAYRRAEDGSF